MDKKYTIQGIIGCILFGIGDWLLGFVDPAKVNGDVFYFISAGHGAEYPSLKITITIVTAVIGALFMHQGCTHISDLMKNDNTILHLKNRQNPISASDAFNGITG